MAEIPEFVYLITVDGEWPINAVVDCHPSTPDAVEKVMLGRVKSDAHDRARAHVWRAKLSEVTEVTLVPSRNVGASITTKEGHNATGG